MTSIPESLCQKSKRVMVKQHTANNQLTCLVRWAMCQVMSNWMAHKAKLAKNVQYISSNEGTISSGNDIRISGSTMIAPMGDRNAHSGMNNSNPKNICLCNPALVLARANLGRITIAIEAPTKYSSLPNLLAVT